jgi:hypothetical protein
MAASFLTKIGYLNGLSSQAILSGKPHERVRCVRVNSLAPSYTEAEAAVALGERLAAQTLTETTAARVELMKSLGRFPLDGPARPKSPNTSPSSRPTACRLSPEANTKSTAG